MASQSGLSESQLDVREAIRQLTSQFSNDYWRDCDKESRYPHELYDALSEGQWIGITLPTQYGGAGLGISEAAMMLQTIAESGGGVSGAQSIHANVYPIMPLIEFGSEEQKNDWLPRILDGRIRSCFMITEPNVGSETLKIKTTARKEGNKWIINGQKIWTSSAQVASHGVILARTSEPTSTSRSAGLSLFFAPLRNSAPKTPKTQDDESSALRKGIEMHKIDKMGGNAVDANEVWLDEFEVSEDCLIGEEGKGFKKVLFGMNAERVLLAAESLGTGYAALRQAVDYASQRVVFGRAIGQYQGVQHPLAMAWANLEAARHLTYAAAKLYDERGGTPEQIGAQANSAKLVASEAGFKACEAALMSMGGMGYAKEYHVERYLRDSFVPRLAPVSREMVLNYLSTSVLKLPKSY
ncbi:acyl-CoA dehydrogenase NM domain-like protein [Meira miltonrushii]|uniref:Acyl-CoA dehydrogenase NM domain-like protein n=1 Tax=Meira miltonrushii TaxID=1280837 RepID=A0A316V750_9BASI|nr:acyl-CoA dehydrogenase NM domain-like protein [Meira miltonrushii]PWN33427.1 acyl-CoA dehydrogenase NM domain-like protein [Meira miltonrushii]